MGVVVDVVVIEDEIFILRKNNEKNFIRVVLYLEKKGGKFEFCNVFEGKYWIDFLWFFEKWYYLCIGEIYISYVVSLKLFKIYLAYGENLNFWCG